MKTFLVAVLYIAVVAALDLGGAVWTGFHTAPAAHTAAVTNVVPAKTVNAVDAPVANPSDT